MICLIYGKFHDLPFRHVYILLRLTPKILTFYQFYGVISKDFRRINMISYIGLKISINKEA